MHKFFSDLSSKLSSSGSQDTNKKLIGAAATVGLLGLVIGGTYFRRQSKHQKTKAFGRSKVIAITGASDGIGKAIAIQLSKQGASLALAARDENKLREVQTICRQNQLEWAETPQNHQKGPVYKEIKVKVPETIIVRVDVSDPDQCVKFIREVEEKLKEIDVLINNAGASMHGLFSEMKDEKEMRKVFEQSMKVNFFGSVNTTHAALSALKRRKGLIVAVSSWQGFQGFPYSSAYNASKHAMNGFFDCLRMELKDEKSGVDVLLVCPGPVDTNISSRRLLSPKESSGPTGAMSAEECAYQIIQSIANRDRELIMERTGKMIKYLSPFAPSFVDNLVLSGSKAYWKSKGTV